MIDQSILRAQHNRESSTEKQRQSCVVLIMNKIYEAKITKKDKPFIHGMYQNYHLKFCNKFKSIYMEQAREAFERGNEQKKLDKAFESKQSIIASKSQSQISQDSSFLRIFEEDKKNSSSEIRDNENKKITFRSEIKTQIIPNEMKKKNTPKQPEFATSIKVQEKKSQFGPPLFLNAQIPELNANNRLEAQINKGFHLKKQKIQPNQVNQPIEKIQQQRQVIKSKEEEKHQKIKQFKTQNQNFKKEAIKDKKQSQDQCEEVEQQDNSPSFYDIKRKLQQIDEPNKYMTRSQIVTSYSNHQNLNKQELKATSHIILKKIDQNQNQALEKVVKNEQKIIQGKNKLLIQDHKPQLQVPLQQKLQLFQDKNKALQDSYQKNQKSQLLNQLILQSQRQQANVKNFDQEKPQIPLRNEKSSKNDSQEKKQNINEQQSILTKSMAQNSQIQIGSPKKTEQYPFTISLQSNFINDPLLQNVLKMTNIQKSNQIIKENTQSQNEYSQKIINSASVQHEKIEVPIEIDAKVYSKSIEVSNEKQTKVTSLCNNSQNIDDYEGRVDKLVASLAEKIDKKIKPCEKCAGPVEQQSQSQKNSSDDGE